MAKKSKKPFSKLVLVAVILLVGILLGTAYQSNNSNKEIESYKRDLNQREEDIDLILQDRARIIETRTSKYEFTDFGVNSPLFENKQSKNIKYWYRDREIIHRTVSLGEVDNFGSLLVEVWSFQKDSQATQFGMSRNYAIFTGYENYSLSPTLVEELVTSGIEKYVNPNDIEMFWTYDEGPKGGIYAVRLNYFQGFGPSGRPFLFRITQGNLGNVQRNSSEILDTKKKIIEVADTVNYRK